MKRILFALLALAACGPGDLLDCGGLDARAATPAEIATMRAATGTTPTFFDRMRIMTIGDSNTDAGSGVTPGSYRKTLWDLFWNNGLHITFVGTKASPSFIASEWIVTTTPYDCVHNGTGSATLSILDSLATPEISKVHPDTIIFYAAGANDLYLGASAATANTSLNTTMTHFIAQCPTCQFWVMPPGPAKVNGSYDANLDARRATYLGLMPTTLAALGARIHYVDTYTPLSDPANFATYYVDNVHLSYAGLAVVANTLFAAMRPPQ